MKPMRPGFSLPPLDTYDGPIPKGWVWQYKLNDERAILTPDGTLWNRFGTKIAGHKARAFAWAVERAVSVFPSMTVDVALLGYRGHFRVGSIVVLDLPGFPGNFHIRHARLSSVINPLIWNSDGGYDPINGPLHFLEWSAHPVALFRRSRGFPGVEGVIGRNPNVPYIQGDTRDMCKSKHS